MSVQGEQGVRGERGPRGNTGRPGPLTRVQTLVMFLFVVLAFTLMAYRIEVIARHIKVSVYNECLVNDANAVKRTNLYRGLIDIERHNPFVKVSPATIHQRIRLYTDAIPGRIDCGEKP